MNLNAALDLVFDSIRRRARSIRRPCSFQKLRVYQRSIEFLALTKDVIAALLKRNAISPINCFAQPSRNPRNIAEGAGRTLAVQRW